MTFYIHNFLDEDDFVAIDNLDYAEDKLIELCEDMKSAGVHTLEIASALLFTVHYVLCQHEGKHAGKYYRYLFKQTLQQIAALEEYKASK